MSVFLKRVVCDTIKDCMYDISNFDADFTGENGDEYLWEETKEFGYKSNQDYLINSLCNKYNHTEIERMLQEFFSNWLDDDYYYSDYDWQYYKIDEGFELILTYSSLED